MIATLRTKYKCYTCNQKPVLGSKGQHSISSRSGLIFTMMRLVTNQNLKFPIHDFFTKRGADLRVCGQKHVFDSLLTNGRFRMNTYLQHNISIAMLNQHHTQKLKTYISGIKRMKFKFVHLHCFCITHPASFQNTNIRSNNKNRHIT